MASPNCRFTYCTDDIHECGAPTDFGTPTLYIAVPIFTIIFLLIGISGCVVCCLPLKRFFDTKLVGMLIVITAVCMWIFWVVNFLSQLNPLQAPRMETLVAGHIRKMWDFSFSPRPYCQTW